MLQALGVRVALRTIRRRPGAFMSYKTVKIFLKCELPHTP